MLENTYDNYKLKRTIPRNAKMQVFIRNCYFDMQRWKINFLLFSIDLQLFDMIRKKQVQQLEPIKITKTEANYQALMLDMMSKLVSEQRESNRLLRRLTGENDNQLSQVSLLKGSSRPLLQTLQKSMPLTVNSPKKQTEDQSNEHSEHDFIISSNPFSFIPSCMKDKEEANELHILNENSQKIIKSIDGLGETMKRIEASLSSKNSRRGSHLETEGVRGLKRDKTKEFAMQDSYQQTKQNLEKPLQKIVQSHKEDDTMKNGFNCFDKKDNNTPKQDKVKKIKTKRQKKGERLSAFQTSYIEKALEIIKPINGKPQLLLNRELQQKKNYSILTQILPYSDRREMKIKIPVEQVMKYYQIQKISQEDEAHTITHHWLGNVYRATASICWNLLSNHELSFDQTKILFTENIIFNLIEFMRTIKGIENGSSKMNRCKLIGDINSTSASILDYLCVQYPQTKVEDANIALRRAIPNIDNKGQAEFDLISKVSQAKEVIFRKKESRNYTQQIMKTINYMIQRSNQEFDDFKNLFSSIFQEVYRPMHKRRTTAEMEQQLSHDDHIYSEKVRNYTKYAISQKINKNTPKYTQQQIENGIFFVKSPSVLRVITKWVQQLDQIIRDPEQLIKNTQNQFKDHNGLPLYLYAQIKTGLYKEILKRQADFEKKVQHIKQECYHMQVLLALENFTADESQKHISREQTSVGKYCYYLKSAISSYICSELNEAIHFLLQLPMNVNQTKIGITDHFYQEECKKDLQNLNLIHFKIFDLLRCKCISKQSEIVYLIKRLNDKSNDPSDPFKIIRIKDRLSNGTRDILINAQLRKGLVCEIQLAVISNIDKKQEQLDQYNHFLYELKRAKLGPISENAAIWSTLEQRTSYFQKLIEKQEKRVKHGELPHDCINMEKSEANASNTECFTRPIICVSCKTFYQIPRTCLFNISCKKCSKTFCGQCHYQRMSPSQRKEFLFDRHFRPIFQRITEYTDYDKPLPRFGFLVRKYYLKKQLFFFRILSKSTEEIIPEKGKINIEIIISVVEKGKIRNFAINQRPLLAEVRNGQYYLNKDKRYRQEISKLIIYSIDTSKDLEKKTGPLSELFEIFSKQKFKYINLLKQPAYIDEIKMIKRTKQIKKESKELRAILEPQTALTYLKLDKIVILVQIQTEEKALHSELVKILNVSKLRSYAIEKSFAVSMDFRQMTNEMDYIKTAPKEFPKELYQSFSKRVTKLYLNFGKIQQVTFLSQFTKIRVLYLSSNCITSLAGIQTLTQLEYVCFDKNNVDSLLPLAGLTNLVQISGSENKINSLSGLQGLSKVTILTLYKNQISEIKNLQNMKLKELSLNNNPIERIENLAHMDQSLEELCIGGTSITTFNQIYSFTSLRKLSLDGMKFKSIEPTLLKGLQGLVYLSLADNEIQIIQNMQYQGLELVQLNLKNNRLRQVSGLQSCGKLQILKLQHNFISDIAGFKGIERLKVVYLQQNPLEDCTDLLTTDIEVVFNFTLQNDPCDPLYMPKSSFYRQYERYQREKGESSSGNNDDNEVQEE